MDQKKNAGVTGVTPGANWPNLPPDDKLDILRRYRNRCQTGDVDHQFIAEDVFVAQVVEEDLVDLYTTQEIQRNFN